MYLTNAGQQQVESSLPEEQGSHPFILNPGALQLSWQWALSEKAPNNGRHSPEATGKRKYLYLILSLGTQERQPRVEELAAPCPQQAVQRNVSTHQ